MKTYITLFFLSICSLLFSQEIYIVTKNSSTLTWGGKAAVGGYAPEGTLQIQKATITCENNTITTLEIIVDMTSLYQENKQLSGHLRDKDFFHVKKYKTAKFTLSEPAAISSGTCILNGYMTIKDTKNKEQVKATVTMQEGMISIAFNHTMDRTTYGVNYNSPSIFKSLKENVIADDFTLKGSLTFIKK
ncbi:YceI family protein [uncultured Dokdonia sp.]|uniref:YceI family protein n=1 Tax=uncultured Dokdonia sp. TaxID=575653 RepID=UPI00260E046D|nr:YceI family protein [uncultured Dokdonia sp.]